MKKFMVNYSYESVRLFLDQIVLAMLGLMMSFVSIRMSNVTLSVIVGVFSVGFYLFLVWHSAWETGNRDRGAFDKEAVGGPLTGLYMGLLANSLNIVLAILVMLAQLTQIEVLGNIGAVSTVIILLGEGAYAPLLLIPRIVSQETGLGVHWLTCFAIVLPALIAETVGYLMGRRGMAAGRASRMDFPKSDRPDASSKKTK